MANHIYSTMQWNRLLGVVGGVGPVASAAFCNSVALRHASLFHALRQTVINDQDTFLAASEVSHAAWTEAEIGRVVRFPEPIARTNFFDQQQIPLIMYSNPQIPDRTDFILGKLGRQRIPQSADPLPSLVLTARRLLEFGANFLAIPCNTAHYFLPELRKALPTRGQSGEAIEILDMLDLTLSAVIRSTTASQTGLKVGLLATSGTIRSHIYRDRAAAASLLSGVSLQILSPDDVSGGSQDQIMEAIYGTRGIKAGFTDACTEEGRKSLDLLLGQVSCLASAGCQVIVAGCTELACLLTQNAVDQAGLPVKILDPSLVLADEAVRKSLLGRSLPEEKVELYTAFSNGLDTQSLRCSGRGR